jgi:inhibitor of cysteine peptidase
MSPGSRFVPYVLAAAVIAAVAIEPAPARTPRTVVVDETFNNRRVTVNYGDTLIVRLPTNPSTGYSWSVAESSPLVQFVGQSTGPGNGVPGSPTTQALTFRVVGAGNVKAGRVILVYRRPWQSGSGSRKFSLALAVN